MPDALHRPGAAAPIVRHTRLAVRCARFALVALSLTAQLPHALEAQEGPEFELSVANIMRGPEHYGRAPGTVRWTADGRWIYFRWAEPESAWDTPESWFRVRPQAGATPERVSDAAADSVAPYISSGPITRDGRTRVVAANGDLWMIDVRRGTGRQLTSTVDAESAPQFSVDERHVLFLRERNAFALELASGALRQLTDVRSGRAPADSTPSREGQLGTLRQDQRDLLAAIRDEARADSVAKARRDSARERQLPAVYAPAGERIVSLSVSPSMDAAIVITAVSGVGARVAAVPNYVTASGFTEEIQTRSKVGDTASRSRAWHLQLGTGKLSPIATIGTDSAERAGAVRVVEWQPNGETALLFATSADFKSRYFVSVRSDGRATVTDALQDSAWVNGPCFGCAGWLPDGRAWFVSEASGYAHLYAAQPDGTNRTALTSGDWELLDAELSPDRRAFRMHTSETSPFVREFWQMPATGGTRQRLTRETGGHDVVISPDGNRVADVFSASNLPPELFVQSLDGRDRLQLTTSTSAAFQGGKWIAPEIVRIPASDGVDVPARIYTPENLGATRNGAAVIFVHGAGYLHNVHEYWSSYSREYMFHHLLASKGYIVLDIDYRASAGYGRDWRTAVYRHMGGRDLQDHVDGSRWLQQQYNIAPERVGIYGGSYGGFITLMALFTAPKEFGAGAALRSVTDWAHYNQGYTGRILNLPQDDTLAYRRSSPIFFAEGLEDPLLIAHGMVDTNVHFQDVVRLAQRLIELGKTEWEMAVYPVENHGFSRPDSWTDEYRRILKLFETTIGPAGSKVTGAP